MWMKCSVCSKEEKEMENTTLLGWSPTATGIYNLLLHPVVIVLALSLFGLVLVIILYIRLWKLIMLFERLCELC